MTEIKLRADDAREMAQHVSREASNATQQMDSLRAYLNNLSDSFTGQTATAFDTAFNDWKRNADLMLTSLDDLGVFLNNAADTIESTDAQIASTLRGN